MRKMRDWLTCPVKMADMSCANTTGPSLQDWLSDKKSENVQMTKQWYLSAQILLFFLWNVSLNTGITPESWIFNELWCKFLLLLVLIYLIKYLTNIWSYKVWSRPVKIKTSLDLLSCKILLYFTETENLYHIHSQLYLFPGNDPASVNTPLHTRCWFPHW